MLTRENQRRLWCVGAFVVPWIGMKICTLVFGGAPQQSHAAAPDAPSVDLAQLQIVQPQWTAQQQRAADHALQLADRAFGSSPLYRGPMADLVSLDNNDEEPSQSPLEVTIQMVLASSSGNIALINNERYGVGDQLNDNEWTVTAIDGEQRSVTFRHSGTSETTTRFVHSPGGDD